MRMLLTMSSYTAASRAICFATAASADVARRASDPHKAREAHERASLLTPVAKAFSTDIGNEVASLGVQVFGGMGYIEEAGAAQIMRDARICAIYEGTNGVQAIDLVTRKLRLGDAGVLWREIEDMRKVLSATKAADEPALRTALAAAEAAVSALEAASDYLIGLLDAEPDDALAGATPYLRLFGLARGATFLLEGALLARHENKAAERRVVLARFFCENLVTAARLAQTVIGGGEAVHEGRAAFH